MVDKISFTFDDVPNTRTVKIPVDKIVKALLDELRVTPKIPMSDGSVYFKANGWGNTYYDKGTRLDTMDDLRAAVRRFEKDKMELYPILERATNDLLDRVRAMESLLRSEGYVHDVANNKWSKPTPVRPARTRRTPAATKKATAK